MATLLLGLLGCGLSAAPNAPPSQAEVEAFIGSPLPAEATNLQLSREAGIDTAVYVRFDAPPAVVEAFVAALGVNTLTPNANPFPNNLDSAISGWDTTSAQTFAGSSFTASSGKVYEILVEQTVSDVWRVYLRVHTL